MGQQRKGNKAEARRRRRKRKIIIFVVELLIIAIVLTGLYIYLKLSKLDTGNKLGETEKNQLTQETRETLEGYTTLALFGLDNRSNGDFSSGNSDVIIIASINNKTKEVKLASVYRDTYLNITGDDGYHKANAAYAHGGPKQAIDMLNVNLDLDITDYVCVDFNAVAEAVDILGGLDVEMTWDEASLTKGYIKEIAEVTGKAANYLDPWETYPSGVATYHLDGVQATAYARIRYTAGDDYKRTERQRLIIAKMVEKALASDIGTINQLIDEIFPLVKTSLSQTEILGLATDAFSYSLGETTGFPFDKTTDDLKSAGDCVIPVDLANNVEQLHAFLFEAEDYTVTSAVQKISDEIAYATGVWTKAEP